MLLSFKSKDNLVWSPWELIDTAGLKNGKPTQTIRVHLLQARDEERLSHMQSDFLKDSASKRNLKYGTRHLLQLFFWNTVQ